VTDADVTGFPRGWDTPEEEWTVDGWRDEEWLTTSKSAMTTSLSAASLSHRSQRTS